MKIKQLIEDVYDYIDVKLELIKLDTEEKVTRISIILLEIGVLVTVTIAFVLFGSIALGLYLNYLLQSWYLGFVILAFGQLLTGIIFWLIIRMFPKFWQRKAEKLFGGMIKKLFKH